jgi:hypothetical protein
MPASRRTRRHARLANDGDSQAWSSNREFEAEAQDAQRKKRLSKHSQGLGSKSLLRVARYLAKQLRNGDLAVFNKDISKTLQGHKNGPLLVAEKMSQLLGAEVVAYFASSEELEDRGFEAHPVTVKIVASDGVLDRAQFNCVRRARQSKGQLLSN